MSVFAPTGIPVNEIVEKFEKALSARIDLIMRAQCVLEYKDTPKASHVCDVNFKEVVSVPTFGTDLSGNQCLTSNYGFSLRISKASDDSGFTFGLPLVIELAIYKAFGDICCRMVFNVFTDLDEQLNGCYIRLLDISTPANSVTDITRIHSIAHAVVNVITKPNYMNNYASIKC